MAHQCKKCLLLESAQKEVYNEVAALIEQMEDELKVAPALYEKRLSYCKSCEFLISGMCRKCGCYIELRAIQRSMHCANADNKVW